IRFKHFVFRSATNEDVPAIKNVVYTVLAEYGLKPSENGKDSDLTDIERSYFSRNEFFGAAVDINTNEVIVTIGLYAESNEICELGKMYIKKDSRNHGLGKFLLNTTINIARDMGFRKIYLETISPLQVAIAMYQGAGFRAVKPREVSERVDQAFELAL